MATIFSSSAATSKPPLPLPLPKPHAAVLLSKSRHSLATTLTSTALATAILTTVPPSLAASPSPYKLYYGTAASAANYGGYGGNSNKKAFAKYIYDVPEGRKEKPVSKIQDGTNETDSEFYNPKKKSEKEYLTFLDGFPRLTPKEIALNNLALSNVDLQDLIAIAETVKLEERKDEKGQMYYVYEIDGIGAHRHSLIVGTCAKNKMYAHFVNALNPEWNKDQENVRHIHE